MANPVGSSGANGACQSLLLLDQNGQASLSCFRQSGGRQSYLGRVWHWARWLSAAEDYPEGADCQRRSTHCTSCTWAARPSLNEGLEAHPHVYHTWPHLTAREFEKYSPSLGLRREGSRVVTASSQACCQHVWQTDFTKEPAYGH